MRDAHLLGATLWLRTERRAIAPFGASQARQEHYGALEYDAVGNGTVPSGGGSDHRFGLRGLRGASARSEPAQRTDGGHGQPRRPPSKEGEGTDRGEGLRTALFAGLLSRLQPDRRGLRQDQEPPTQGCGQEQGGFGGSDRGGAIGHHRRGRPRLLRACWIPPCGSPTLKRAVRREVPEKPRMVFSEPGSVTIRLPFFNSRESLRSPCGKTGRSRSL